MSYALPIKNYRIDLNNNPVVSIQTKGFIIGTGFFIASDVLMTCAHVVKNHRNLRALIYYMNKNVVIRLEPILINYSLDYALFSISDEVAIYLDLGWSQPPLDALMQIDCPHESPSPKMVRRMHNPGMYEERLYNSSYLLQGDICIGGTSGSPLSDLDGNVLGLHWASGIKKFKKHSFSVPILMIQKDILKKRKRIKDEGLLRRIENNINRSKDEENARRLGQGTIEVRTIPQGSCS